MKTLGGRGRCHWNIHIFCCTSSPNEELDTEFSYYCLPNFLIFDQLNRTFHIEIRLVDNWLINKNSFKCTHAPMFVFSGTQGKWTRNFRGNCLSQLVILLLVWLVSRLSELFFTPYSLGILVKCESFPKCQCYLQNRTVSVMRGRADILQRHKESGRSSAISSRDLRILIRTFRGKIGL